MITIYHNGVFKTLTENLGELYSLKRKVSVHYPYSIIEEREYLRTKCYVLIFARFKALCVPTLAINREKLRNRRK